MTCWKCNATMVEETELDTRERALQILTHAPLRFWLCACGAREMKTE